jgi:hypothetical protein
MNEVAKEWADKAEDDFSRKAFEAAKRVRAFVRSKLKVK